MLVVQSCHPERNFPTLSTWMTLSYCAIAHKPVKSHLISCPLVSISMKYSFASTMCKYFCMTGRTMYLLLFFVMNSWEYSESSCILVVVNASGCVPNEISLRINKNQIGLCWTESSLVPSWYDPNCERWNLQRFCASSFVPRLQNLDSQNWGYSASLCAWPSLSPKNCWHSVAWTC